MIPATSACVVIAVVNLVLSIDTRLSFIRSVTHSAVLVGALAGLVYLGGLS